jgi:hypothetical protein
VRDVNFLPLNLKWAHTGKPVRERIPPDTDKYCDLLHILKPTQTASLTAELDIEVQPASGSGLLKPGSYRMTLIVAASNARARTFTSDVYIPETWSDDVASMVQHGFYLEGLPK